MKTDLVSLDSNASEMTFWNKWQTSPFVISSVTKNGQAYVMGLAAVLEDKPWSDHFQKEGK